MEKQYTQTDYADKAVEANAQGKKLYRVQKEIEYEVQVPDYNITGYETKEVETLDEEGNATVKKVEIPVKEPIMLEGVDEEGNTYTYQQTHTEVKSKKVEALEIQPIGYYVCLQDNLTDGTLNENFEAEKAAKEANRIAKLYLTAADVERAIYKAKGMDFDDIISLVEAQALEGVDVKALKIELKANNFYRGNAYIDTIGTLLGFTSEMLDKFFETGSYEELK